MSDLKLFDNIKNIYGKISHAAMRAGRSPEEVRLIAVTKTVEIKDILEALESGLRLFGENRIQEASKKVKSEELKARSEDIQWHLIGHLQRNKARDAVRLFDIIHSVDSIVLAQELNHHAESIGKIQRVLIQVKLSEEETKYGVSEKDLPELLYAVNNLGNLKLEGLMTIPPYYEDSEKTRRYFRRLRELRDSSEESGIRLPELSMGMSNDFDVAIQEGATLVRIGTAIFGERSR